MTETNPNMDVWKCPKLCGWERAYSTTRKLATTAIYHPMYGAVTNMEAAKLDIADHDCQTYLEAMMRMRQRRIASASV